jgi:hypothetical protein
MSNTEATYRLIVLGVTLNVSSVVRPSKIWRRMSASGQKRTSDCRPAMSALLPKADIAERDHPWDGGVEAFAGLHFHDTAKYITMTQPCGDFPSRRSQPEVVRFAAGGFAGNR